MTHLTRDLIHSAAVDNVQTAKTLRKRLRAAGLPDTDDMVAKLRHAVALRRERLFRRPDLDPLVSAQFTRRFRLEQYKREKRALATPMLDAWRRDLRARVLQAARYGWDVEREAAKATIEAVCREARRRGWQVRHTSKGRDGRASSRYVIVPGVGEARVSDHELPDTPVREHNRSIGFVGRWNGEVVIGRDWRTTRLEAWMRKVLLAAAGR